MAENWFFFNFSGEISVPQRGVQWTLPRPSNLWASDLSEDEKTNKIHTIITDLSPLHYYQIQFEMACDETYGVPDTFTVTVSGGIDWSLTLHNRLPTNTSWEVVNLPAFSPPSDIIVLSFIITRHELVDKSLNVENVKVLYIVAPYTLFVDVGDWNDFFVEKVYNTDDSSSSVVVNQDYLINGVLSLNTVSSYYRDPTEEDVEGFSTGTTKSTLGFRLLELSCLKLFRHARARYIIQNVQNFKDGDLQNKYDCISIYQSVADQIQTAFTSQEIFGQYQQGERYNINSGVHDFDFSGINFHVLLSYSSYTSCNRETLRNSKYTNEMDDEVLLVLGNFSS